MTELMAATPDLVRWMQEIRELRRRVQIRSDHAVFLKILEKTMRRMPSDPLCGSASPRPLDIAVLPETRGLAEAAAAAGLTQTCNDATRRKFTKTLAAQLPSLLSCWREERWSGIVASHSGMNAYQGELLHPSVGLHAVADTIVMGLRRARSYNV